MVDPNNITNFFRLDYAKQEFLLFCICVAGKNSMVQARKLEQFLTNNGADSMAENLPLNIVHRLNMTGQLTNELSKVGMGQYSRITTAFAQAAFLYRSKMLSDWTLQDLVSIKGIGPKTARFFLLHTKKDCEYVVLDTHILNWLRTHPKNPFNLPKFPESTPSEPLYSFIEAGARMLIRQEFRNRSLAEADLAIWKKMRA